MLFQHKYNDNWPFPPLKATNFEKRAFINELSSNFDNSQII